MHGTSLITVSGNTALIARALSLHAPLLLRNKVLFGCCFRTDGYLLDGGLSLAGRQVEVPFRPLQQGAFGVPNRAADFHVRRAVAAHARFGEPGFADAQKCRRFARCE